MSQIDIRNCSWALAVAVCAAVAVVPVYVGWLGWRSPYRTDPMDPTHEMGPHESWQIAGLVVSLVVLALLAAWWTRPFAAALGMAGGLCVVFSVEAAGYPDADVLWPIGTFLVFLAAVPAALGIALLASRLRGSRTS